MEPFFTNPSLHWQLYDPFVFLHSELAKASHGLTCAAHSSIPGMRECDMIVTFMPPVEYIYSPGGFASQVARACQTSTVHSAF